MQQVFEELFKDVIGIFKDAKSKEQEENEHTDDKKSE